MGTPYQIDNPTVTFFPNGSLLLLGRGGDPKAVLTLLRDCLDKPS